MTPSDPPIPHHERAGFGNPVSLANWLGHLPPSLVAAHLNIPEELLTTFPRETRASCRSARWDRGILARSGTACGP